jgi:hypothetical protein
MAQAHMIFSVRWGKQWNNQLSTMATW